MEFRSASTDVHVQGIDALQEILPVKANLHNVRYLKCMGDLMFLIMMEKEMNTINIIGLLLSLVLPNLDM